MASPVTVKIRDAGFSTALRKYSQLSKRTPAEICNRKSYAINRRAIWHTKKADAARIRQELGAFDVHNLVFNKSGKNKGKYSRARKHSTFMFDRGAEGRFARIIIARLRKAGKQIPGAAELEKIMVKAFRARLRSIAFLKSGFINPRETFKNWCKAHGVPIGRAGVPQEGQGIGGPKQIGQPKGGAHPANFNWFTKATFFNAASAKHDTRSGLIKFAEPALAKAFDEERVDTIQEIEKRLRQNARIAGIRTN